MDSSKRKQWEVATAIFVVCFIVFGAVFYSPGVFLLPLSRFFHWTRAETATLFTISAFCGMIGSYVVGWLLDRMSVKPVMAGGVALAGIGFIVLSRSNSFGELAIGYSMLGVGVIASTLLPAIVVITRSFDKTRGTVLGVVIAGESAGGMAMVNLASRVLAHYGPVEGWRDAYISLAIPVLLIALPLVLIFVEDLPPISTSVAGAAPDSEGKQSSGELAGFELLPAMKTGTFWLLAWAMFGGGFSLAGEVAHVIPGLVGFGYAATTAALVWSIALGIKSVGQFGFGVVADWLTARLTYTITGIAAGVAVIILIAGAYTNIAVLLFVVINGVTIGTPIVLIPIVQAESLGLRQFATIQGLMNVFSTAGVMLAPVVVAQLFDVTRSYAAGYTLLGVVYITTGIAIFYCAPLSALQPSRASSESQAVLKGASTLEN